MSETTVLVVEDDPSVAELYVDFLEDAYDVRAAASVDEAVSALGTAIDAVLLDRRLPDGTGDEVLETVRERDLRCRVAMVTAVEPDFDIVDMGFDLYVTKPITQNELRRAVETLERRADYDEMIREAASMATKRGLLEAEKDPAELENSESYRRLLERLDDVDAELLQVAESFTPEDYRVLFRDIDARDGRLGDARL